MTHPYGTWDYARSLEHVGEPLAVPEWDAHVLVRPTPCGRRRDAAGAYPLSVIPPDADLKGGLERLRRAGLVSVVLVLDPRLRPEAAALEAAFDVVKPLKTHHLNDPGLGPPTYSKHHRYEVRRALERVEPSEIALSDHLDAWRELYGQLAVRHDLAGVHAFPLAHHALLARLPGLRAFGAFLEDQLVSAHLFVRHEGYAISHLAASAAEGYAAGAAYAVNHLAVAELGGVINFGGGAGVGDDEADGLVRFKKGFSNTSAPSYLVGQVLDRPAYQALCAGLEDSGFFPAYRGARERERSDAHPR